VPKPLVYVAVGTVVGFLVIGAVVAWSLSASDYSGEFDLSAVTTYEPCLDAPGSCPCLRTRDCTQRLRDFQEFPVFWLGESYEGLPLASVDVADYGERNGRRIRLLTMNYGTCLIQPGEESCAVPVTIRVSRFCESPVDLRVIAQERTQAHVRGTDAYLDGDISGPSMILRTSNVAVEIQSGSQAGGAGEVVTKVFRANGGYPRTPSEPFDPPVEDCFPPTPEQTSTPQVSGQ
jgi:hypothetical protein